MKPLSLELKEKILIRVFEGKTYNEISNELNVSKGVITKIVKDFKNGKMFNDESLKDVYIFTEEFISIAREMKKYGLKPEDFLEFHLIWKYFKENNINISKAISILELLRKTENPERIISETEYIVNKAINDGKDPIALLELIYKNLEKEKNINERISKLKNKEKKERENLKDLENKIHYYKKYLVRNEKEYKITRYLLENFSGKIEEIRKILNFLSQLNFEPKKLEFLISLYNDLKNMGINIDEIGDLFNYLKKLIDLGFTPEKIMIFSNNVDNRTPEEIFKEMINFILEKKNKTEEILQIENYKNKLLEEKRQIEENIEDLEKTLNNISRKKEIMTQDLDNLKNKIDELKIIYLSLVEVNEELSKRIDNAKLILDSYIKGFITISSEIKTYEELKNKIIEKKEELSKLEDEIKSKEDILKKIKDKEKNDEKSKRKISYRKVFKMPDSYNSIK